MIMLMVKKYYNDNGLNMLNHTLKNGYSGNTERIWSHCV